jgi:hypothetical protein
MTEAIYMVTFLAVTFGLLYVLAKSILKMVGDDDEQD